MTKENKPNVSLVSLKELKNDLKLIVKGGAFRYYYIGLFPYEDEEDGETYSYDSFDENDLFQIDGISRIPPCMSCAYPLNLKDIIVIAGEERREEVTRKFN